MRKIDTIIIHCSATRPSQKCNARIIDSWHKKRGWKSIGYHYVIDRAGYLEKGRKEEEIGAHAQGHNGTSIGICLIGGLQEKSGAPYPKTSLPEEVFTASQLDTLRRLCTELRRRYRTARIIGHNQISAKACPCFDVPRLMLRWYGAGAR